MALLKGSLRALFEKAKEMGASSAKLISTKDVFVEDYVRIKCQYGCRMYGIRLTCPPYTPTPEETRKWLKNYSKALLIEFKNLKNREDLSRVHEIGVALERDAFLSGFYRALVLVSGPCRYCKPCVAERAKNRGSLSKADCVYPLKARPSMEAVGIDVYKTARKAGFSINVVKEGQLYKSFILLLLE
jgi:predicted metal-binding protein